MLFLSCPAYALPAEEINDQVRFKVSTGSVKGATDNRINTSWEPEGEGAALYMKFPEEGAGYVRIDWEFDSQSYEFVQYGADKQELSTRTEKDSYAAITHLFPIVEGARFAMLKLSKPGQKICRVKVYSKGELPDDVLNFDPPCDKCDLMVVSTHQDDELIFFGGIIPYYGSVKGKKVEVVYMANCGRLRRGEALNGLWAVGERHYPEFINLKDKRVESMKKGVELWGGKNAILSELVRRIRRYRPDVILTHDLDGEYGHNQHKITARAMQIAIEAAADPAQYPDSCDQYGAWQVKKLYLHLYPENVVDFDWNASYAELGGSTPLKVARAGYAEHASQQEYYQVKDGGQYDNSLFGLAYSVVGEDATHDDLFENISAQSTSEPIPTAETTPIAEVSSKPVLFYSPEPTSSATAVPQPNSKIGTTAGRIGLFIGGGIALIGILSGVQTISYVRKRRRRK